MEMMSNTPESNPETPDMHDAPNDPSLNGPSSESETETQEMQAQETASTGDAESGAAPDGLAAPDAHAGDGHAAVLSSEAYEGDLEVSPLTPDDFDADTLRSRLRTMMLSRRLDEKMMNLLKQGRGHFHIGAAGHEAAQMAVGMHSRPGPGPGHDWFCFYYRDLTMALTLGMRPEDALLAHLAKADDPNSGGRQMPEHFGLRDLNIMTTSSSVGAQFLPALGFAMGVQYRGENNYVYASCGDGATSQGDFHEALNWASRRQAPVLFFVQDNKYAISVPVEDQTAGGSAYKLARGYDGLTRMRVDGTDFFAASAASRAALDHIRSGNGPVCLVADVVRLYPHSSSDDHSKYRTPNELEADKGIDPIKRFESTLLDAGVLNDGDAEEMRDAVRQQIDDATAWARQQADPDASSATTYVYFEGDEGIAYNSESDIDPDGEPMVMVDAINRTLKEEMKRDDSILVYGEDVAGNKGGVFTATKDLTDLFGEDRCFNSPLAEASIIGTAVGLAASGFKPVVEIQFADYIWPAMQQIRNQVAPFRYRSNNEWACPMVIRVPAGGYIHGGLCHSQNIESIFGHMPGLKVVMPSTASDAKGLLTTAIRSQDPIIFLEHKALYRDAAARTPTPPENYTLPLGKARTVRSGDDLTIITYGKMVPFSEKAAKELEKEGISIEIIDLRTITPLDSEAIIESVKRTNRAMVVYEDHEFIGFGAEISAQIADVAFTYLDAPVRRVAGAFTSIPFAHSLEREVLPSDTDILDAARDLAAF